MLTEANRNDKHLPTLEPSKWLQTHIETTNIYLLSKQANTYRRKLKRPTFTYSRSMQMLRDANRNDQNLPTLEPSKSLQTQIETTNIYLL